VFALSNVMWPVHPSEAYLRFVWGISSEGPPFSNVSHSQRHEKDESPNESKAQSGTMALFTFLLLILFCCAFTFIQL